MLTKYSENKRLWALICLVCALFAVFIPICRLSVYGYERCEQEEEIQNSREQICFFWMEDQDGRESGRRVLYLYASPALLITVGDRDMAVLLRFSLAEGWKIESAQGFREGEKLHITPGEGCILLDGALEETDSAERDSVCLLKLEVIAENGPETVLSFDIQWKKESGDFLYVRNRNQSMSVYDFHYGEISDAPSESESFPPEPPSEESKAFGQEETVTEGKESSQTEPPTSRPDDSDVENPDEVIYLGCQETPVRDGQYAVRFLFYGFSSSYCPILSVQGGGVLYVTVTHPDRVDMWENGKQIFFCPDNGKRLTVCTFRGLMADRSYEFQIVANGEEYTVNYLYGKYGDSKNCDSS